MGSNFLAELANSPPLRGDDGDLTRSAYQFSQFLAYALIVAGGLNIAGWIYRIPLLKGAMFGTFVSPNAALLFLAAGTSVLLQRHSRTTILGQFLGVAIAAFASASAFQYVSGRDLGVDSWFLLSRLPDWTISQWVGRMAGSTAVAFILTGIALVALRLKKSLPLDLSATGVMIVGYLAIIGYIYGLRSFYGYIMALPTAVLLVLTAAMLLCAARQSVIRSILLNDNAGGVMLRRMAPFVFILLPMLGWARLRSQAVGLFPLEFAVALFVLATILVFSAGALHTASTLNLLDTERKRAQSALVRTEKLAAAGRLAATVAHEINNPLAAAMNALFLARTSSPEQAANFIEVAERELQRVSAVTRQSLGFYRGQSKSETLDVGNTLDEVVELLRPAAVAKEVKLTRSEGAPLAVVADAGELRQVLANLVANAIDATPNGGRVTLSAAENGDRFVDIHVQDSGSGIPAKLHREIFEPFFTTKPNVGTGLGLFVVKELVTKNRGHVTFESSESGSEKGTKFTVSFPRPPASRHKAVVA